MLYLIMPTQQAVILIHRVSEKSSTLHLAP